jgi:hypothetical protein
MALWGGDRARSHGDSCQILMCPDDDTSAIKNFIVKNYRPYALVSRSITRGNRKFPIAMFTRACARQRRVCERINLSEREIIQKRRFEHYLTQGKTEKPARALFLVKAPSLKTRWKQKEMKRDSTFCNGDGNKDRSMRGLSSCCFRDTRDGQDRLTIIIGSATRSAVAATGGENSSRV